MSCVYIVKVETIHGSLFVFKNYCSSGDMLPNYSVPCPKGSGGSTIATRYNHKIILVDDTDLFPNLKHNLTVLPHKKYFPIDSLVCTILLCPSPEYSDLPLMLCKLMEVRCQIHS